MPAAVGGASILAGTAIGGAVGGGAALIGLGRRFARVRLAGSGGAAGWLEAAWRYWEGGRRFRIGPHAQPNFPWVLLDRALLHYDNVVRRTHARRGAIAVSDGSGRAGLVADFARAQRRRLDELFRAIRRSDGDPPRELREDLEMAVGRILERVDPVAVDARARCEKKAYGSERAQRTASASPFSASRTAEWAMTAVGLCWSTSR